MFTHVITIDRVNHIYLKIIYHKKAIDFSLYFDMKTRFIFFFLDASWMGGRAMFQIEISGRTYDLECIEPDDKSNSHPAPLFVPTLWSYIQSPRLL